MLESGATLMLQLLVAVTGGPAESVAVSPKLEIPPAPVGVPVTAPVEAFRFKPGGVTAADGQPLPFERYAAGPHPNPLPRGEGTLQSRGIH